MQIIVDLGRPPLWSRSLALGVAVRSILMGVTEVNEVILRSNQQAHKKSGGKVPLIPPLYSSGVVYREEPRSWENEHFDTIPVILQRKWADCDDLGPWRAAELRMQGEKASIQVKWKRHPNGNRLYHVVVRRGNGQIEDPSRVLGMGRSSAASAHQGL